MPLFNDISSIKKSDNIGVSFIIQLINSYFAIFFLFFFACIESMCTLELCVSVLGATRLACLLAEP